MLMLERFDCKKLELAMLLDEPPYHNFSSTSCGEPWRADGPLAQAAMCIDLEGYAWLYVAYISDKASTWGTKQVKLVSGGTVLRKELNSAGAWTGRYVELAYKTVAPRIFLNLVGERSTDGYNIISGARLQEDPGSSSDEEKGDELLGREEQTETSAASSRFEPRPQLGCVITWENQAGSTQKWWIQAFDDYKGEKWWLRDFGDCRFGLTEYSRRPYVHILMARLGFVKNFDRSSQTQMIDLSEICSGHLRSIVSSLRAMSKSSMEQRHRRSEGEQQIQ